MIPIHVALVRYDTGDHVDRGTFLRVAAALQVQLTRDFTPVWGTPAVVSAFESLEDVPPASIPLLIVKPGTLEPRFHGFHVTEGDQAIALIEGGPGWSLAASHELLEMVCDPAGERKVPGESLKDSADSSELTPLARRYRAPQGEVSYLVEVSDPCQSEEFAYTIDGVLVSDFVTPRYYDPQGTSGGSYSFTGAVKKPLQVLSGGYITWYTSIKGAPIWQAHRDDDDKLSVGPLAIPAPDFSRHRVDRFTDHVHGEKPATPETGKEELARKSAKRYGDELKDEVRDLLAAYAADRKRRPVRLEKLEPVLKELATNKSYYRKFLKNPNSLFDEPALKGLLPPGSHFRGGRYPDQAEFKTAHDWVKHQIASKAQPVTGLVATTMIKGDTIGGP